MDVLPTVEADDLKALLDGSPLDIGPVVKGEESLDVGLDLVHGDAGAVKGRPRVVSVQGVAFGPFDGVLHRLNPSLEYLGADDLRAVAILRTVQSALAGNFVLAIVSSGRVEDEFAGLFVVRRIALVRSIDEDWTRGAILLDLFHVDAFSHDESIVVVLSGGEPVDTMLSVHLEILVLLNGVGLPDCRVLFSVAPAKLLASRLREHGEALPYKSVASFLGPLRIAFDVVRCSLLGWEPAVQTRLALKIRVTGLVSSDLGLARRNERNNVTLGAVLLIGTVRVLEAGLSIGSADAVSTFAIHGEALRTVVALSARQQVVSQSFVLSAEGLSAFLVELRPFLRQVSVVVVVSGLSGQVLVHLLNPSVVIGWKVEHANSLPFKGLKQVNRVLATLCLEASSRGRDIMLEADLVWETFEFGLGLHAF